MIRPLRRRLLLCGLAAGLLLCTPTLAPREARAWDPSTTHQALIDAAVKRSVWHLRWMEGSQMQRGIFTPLALDSSQLDVEMRGWIQEALRTAHRDLGAHPLGGPGACPGPDAPAVLQRYCVRGDDWELSALGWLRLGTLVEAHPRSRLFTHFTDLDDPRAAQWTDSSDSRNAALRARFSRSAGEPVAGVFAGSNYDGEHASALTRLHDPNDPLALPALSRELRLASLSARSDTREHHLAMALIILGANLHVITDASVPAHARGDAAAFMAPLSDTAGDRGDAMVEFVRGEFGLDLPESSRPNPGGQALFEGFSDHIADPQGLSLAPFTATHFLSSGTLGEARFLEEEMSPSEAASALLPDDHGLDPLEVEGATLSPWPSQSGYLKNAAGRALAAFDRDASGRTYLYLDRAVMRDAASHLLPRTIDTATSVLDLVFAGHGTVRATAAGLIHELDHPRGGGRT